MLKLEYYMRNAKKNEFSRKDGYSVEVKAEYGQVFGDQCDKRGYIKWRAVGGALRIWLTLPPEVQTALMAGQDPAKLLPTYYKDKGIRQFLDSLGPVGKEEFLEAAKELLTSFQKKPRKKRR
jgi:hypothetical protein